MAVSECELFIFFQLLQFQITCARLHNIFERPQAVCLWTKPHFCECWYEILCRSTENVLFSHHGLVELLPCRWLFIELAISLREKVDK